MRRDTVQSLSALLESPLFELTDLLLLPASGLIDAGGNLVLSHNIGKLAEKKWPGLSAKLGAAARTKAKQVHETWKTTYCAKVRDDGTVMLGNYGLLVSTRWPESKVGVMQTHHEPAGGVVKDLLAWTLNNLYLWAIAHHTARIDIVRPAAIIGTGATDSEIGRMLDNQLPDNIRLWDVYGTQRGLW